MNPCTWFRSPYKLNISFLHKAYWNENNWSLYVWCVQHTFKRGTFYKTGEKGYLWHSFKCYIRIKGKGMFDIMFGPIVSPNLITCTTKIHYWKIWCNNSDLKLLNYCWYMSDITDYSINQHINRLQWCTLNDNISRHWLYKKTVPFCEEIKFNEINFYKLINKLQSSY